MDLFRKTMKPVEQVLKDAGVKKDEIDDVSFLSYQCLGCPGTDTFSRSFLSVDQLVSLKSSNSSRSTSMAKSPLKVSTPTKLLPTVRLFKAVSSLVKKEAVAFF